jgi:hypothetical protein
VREVLDEAFGVGGLPSSVRAEQVAVDQLACLFSRLPQQHNP